MSCWLKLLSMLGIDFINQNQQLVCFVAAPIIDPANKFASIQELLGYFNEQK